MTSDPTTIRKGVQASVSLVTKDLPVTPGPGPWDTSGLTVSGKTSVS